MEIPTAAQMVRNQFTIFVVERRKSNKSENYFMGGTTLARNQNLVLGYNNDTLGLMAFWANDVAVSVPSYKGSVEPVRIWSFVKPAGQREIYIDGQKMNSGYNNPDPILSWNGAAIGRYFDRFYQGVLYEVLIYNQALSTEARQKVEGYLSHKWAVSSLSSGHPYKMTPP
jgi:hypothetical protein